MPTKVAPVAEVSPSLPMGAGFATVINRAQEIVLEPRDLQDHV